MANVSLRLALIARISKKIKVHCEQTRELTDDLHDFFGLCSILSGLGNFVVDCHI